MLSLLIQQGLVKGVHCHVVVLTAAGAVVIDSNLYSGSVTLMMVVFDAASY